MGRVRGWGLGLGRLANTPAMRGGGHAWNLSWPEGVTNGPGANVGDRKPGRTPRTHAVWGNGGTLAQDDGEDDEWESDYEPSERGGANVATWVQYSSSSAPTEQHEVHQ